MGSTTRIGCGVDNVFDYIARMDGVNKESVRPFVVINSPYVCTGSTIMTSRPIAMGTNYEIDIDAKNAGYVGLHELGYGFGNLADEYIRYNEEAPEEEKRRRGQELESGGFGCNVGVDLSALPWRHFFSISKYSMVGAFEGAGYIMPKGSIALKRLV